MLALLCALGLQGCAADAGDVLAHEHAPLQDGRISLEVICGAWLEFACLSTAPPEESADCYRPAVGCAELAQQASPLAHLPPLALGQLAFDPGIIAPSSGSTSALTASASVVGLAALVYAGLYLAVGAERNAAADILQELWSVAVDLDLPAREKVTALHRASQALQPLQMRLLLATMLPGAAAIERVSSFGRFLAERSQHESSWLRTRQSLFDMNRQADDFYEELLHAEIPPFREVLEAAPKEASLVAFPPVAADLYDLLRQVEGYSTPVVPEFREAFVGNELAQALFRVLMMAKRTRVERTTAASQSELAPRTPQAEQLELFAPAPPSLDTLALEGELTAPLADAASGSFDVLKPFIQANFGGAEYRRLNLNGTWSLLKTRTARADQDYHAALEAAAKLKAITTSKARAAAIGERTPERLDTAVAHHLERSRAALDSLDALRKVLGTEVLRGVMVAQRKTAREQESAELSGTTLTEAQRMQAEEVALAAAARRVVLNKVHERMAVVRSLANARPGAD